MERQPPALPRSRLCQRPLEWKGRLRSQLRRLIHVFNQTLAGMTSTLKVESYKCPRCSPMWMRRARGCLRRVASTWKKKCHWTRVLRITQTPGPMRRRLQKAWRARPRSWAVSSTMESTWQSHDQKPKGSMSRLDGRKFSKFKNGKWGVRSRFVAREFRWQQPNRDDIFSVTSSSNTSRVLRLILAKHPGHNAYLADVECAFFHASEDELCYVEAPREWLEEAWEEEEVKTDWVWQLAKQLYGRQKAPRRFGDHAAGIIVDRVGCQRCPEVPHLYFHEEEGVALEVHVDDFYAVGPGQGPKRVLDEIAKYLTMQIEGPFNETNLEFVHLKRRTSPRRRVDPASWRAPEKVARAQWLDHGVKDAGNASHEGGSWVPRRWAPRTGAIHSVQSRCWSTDVHGHWQTGYPTHGEWARVLDAQAGEARCWSNEAFVPLFASHERLWNVVFSGPTRVRWRRGHDRQWLGYWRLHKEVPICPDLQLRWRQPPVFIHQTAVCDRSKLWGSWAVRNCCRSEWRNPAQESIGILRNGSGITNYLFQIQQQTTQWPTGWELAAWDTSTWSCCGYSRWCTMTWQSGKYNNSNLGTKVLGKARFLELVDMCGLKTLKGGISQVCEAVSAPTTLTATQAAQILTTMTWLSQVAGARSDPGESPPDGGDDILLGLLLAAFTAGWMLCFIWSRYQSSRHQAKEPETLIFFTRPGVAQFSIVIGAVATWKSQSDLKLGRSAKTATVRIARAWADSGST